MYYLKRYKPYSKEDYETTSNPFTLKDQDKVYLGGVLINIEISKSPKVGLSKTNSLCFNCGMMFFFPDESAHITMEKTSLDLDIVFIKQNQIVKIIEAKGKSGDYMYAADSVIELNMGFCRANNINIGDFLEVRKKLTKEENSEIQKELQTSVKRLSRYNVRYKKGGTTVWKKGNVESVGGYLFQSPGSREIEKKFKNKPMAKYKKGSSIEEISETDGMYLLDDNGDVQMVLQGDERIFSRIHTRKILDFIKKIDSEKSPEKIQSLLEKLGVFIADVILTHDTQEEEYTKD